jgi:hypothetical protein
MSDSNDDASGGSKNDSGSQTDISGKKIFFLYPTASVKNQIITELVQQEYEVYAAKDHVRLARALKKHADSVIFVNIDEGMTALEWERWIGALMTSLPNLKIGVFSSNSDEEVKNRYLNELRVACGYMGLKVDMSKMTPKILELIKVLNVKGRRKYLRATTELEGSATVNMPHGGDFIKGTIKDISVVGISCSFDTDPALSKNAIVKDIQIRLQSQLIKVEAVVFGSRMDGGEKIYVMIFTQRVDPEIKVKIRKYIQQNLQNKMDLEIS